MEQGIELGKDVFAMLIVFKPLAAKGDKILECHMLIEFIL